MSFATTEVDLEIIIPSEVSQKEKDKYHMISFIWSSVLTRPRVALSIAGDVAYPATADPLHPASARGPQGLAVWPAAPACAPRRPALFSSSLADGLLDAKGSRPFLFFSCDNISMQGVMANPLSYF